MQKPSIAALLLAAIVIGALLWQNMRLTGALEQGAEHLAEIEQQLANRSITPPPEEAKVDKAPLLTPPERRQLRRAGLGEPEIDLRASLMSRPDLISSKGVLGGRMGFHDPDQIHILSDRWVLAGFDDGHRAGKLLLEYRVSKGQIDWKVLGEMIL